MPLLQKIMYTCDFVCLGGVYRLTPSNTVGILTVLALLEKKMRSRGPLAVGLSTVLSISLLTTTTWGVSGSGLGTVISADHSHVGTAAAPVGATGFAGGKLGTEGLGSPQGRAGAARLVVTGAGRLVWGTGDGSPS